MPGAETSRSVMADVLTVCWREEDAPCVSEAQLLLLLHPSPTQMMSIPSWRVGFDALALRTLLRIA
jgi:hypothetical protein